MEKLLINAVTTENLDLLLPLIVDYQRFYKVTHADTERNRHFFSRFIRKPEHGLQHLALCDGDVAGFTTLYFSNCSLKAASVAILYDLYVVPELRRQGVGRALLENAARVARQHGMEQMLWYSAPDNHQARALYERVGAEASRWVQYTLDLPAKPGAVRKI